jgi:acyl-CoA synthetase (AMP-forming)/AMP-acid ligase II
MDKFNKSLCPPCLREMKTEKFDIMTNDPAKQTENPVSLLQKRAELQPDKLAYIFLNYHQDDPEEMTYAQLEQRVRAMAATLQSYGAKDERALIILPEGMDYIVSFFACLYAGVHAVTCPFPMARKRQFARLQRIAEDCGAKFIITTPRLQQQKIPGLNTLIFIDPKVVLEYGNAEKWIQPDIQPDQIALFQYTSGSTSQPKGVTVLHRNIRHNLKMLEGSFSNGDPGEVIVNWLPLSHDMGLMLNILYPLWESNLAVLMAPTDFIQKPIRWLEAITQYEGTMSVAPNFGFDYCVNEITREQEKGLDLSQWKIAVNGSEPVQHKTQKAFVERFGPYGFKERAFCPGYGLAESTLMVTCRRREQGPVYYSVDKNLLRENKIQATPPSAENSVTLVGSGYTWLDEKVMIIDPDTFETKKQGQMGEIWVSGQHVTQGYWDRDKQKSDSFHAHLSHYKETFLRTGDLGFFREDGELFVTGRMKDLIIIRGHNYAPQDIELTVEESHPALEAHGTIALPLTFEGNEYLGIVAEIKRAFMSNPDAYPEIIQMFSRAIATEHQIEVSHAILIRRGALPKTTSGKKARQVTKQQFFIESDRSETLILTEENKLSP